MSEHRSDVVDLAVVGAGRMGSMHLRALGSSRAVRVSDVVEPYAPRRLELQARGHRVHERLDDLLAQRLPDAVLVCAPTDQHATVVRRVLAAGVPVLCEKPAGLTWQEVDRTRQLARGAGVPLQVAYWRRFVPQLMALREQLLAGELGEILNVVCAQWDGAPPPAAFRASSGGIFVDMGVHEFDQIRWLTGQEIDTVHAVTTPALDRSAHPDVDGAQALLGLDGGTAASVSLGRHFPGGDVVTAEVYATKGYRRLVVLDPGDDEAMLEALARQAESFADLVRGEPREGAGIDDAVAAMRAADRAQRASHDIDHGAIGT